MTLSGLKTNATVYLYDENNVMTGSFKPEAETETISVADYLPEDSYELHITQAVSAGENGTDPSPELVLSAGVNAKLDFEILCEEDFVRDGETTTVRFVPHVTQSITSFTLTSPDGTNYNLLEGFYFRAKANGEYRVTLVSEDNTRVKTFNIANIDAVDYGAEYSTEEWTDENVVITLTPTAVSGVAQVEIDGVKATAADGKYTVTATENGEHTVKIVTNAGFEYERTFTVGNIDRTDPALDFTISFTANGITLDYAAESPSGGKLYADFNGTTREITEESRFTLDEEGKYEIYFTNGLGKSTGKMVYYVSYGAEKAQLADISVEKDGLVTVTAKARADVEATLYRAGEDEAIPSMKADKAGKYYLNLLNGTEIETVVLYVQSPALGGGSGSSGVIGAGEGSGADAVMIAGIVIGCVAIAAAAVACTLIVIKRRKKA